MEATGERLNIDYTAVNRFRLRISLWSDGAFFLAVTLPGPRRTGGWAHRAEHIGLLTGVTAAQLAERIELTFQTPEQAAHYWPESTSQSHSE